MAHRRGWFAATAAGVLAALAGCGADPQSGRSTGAGSEPSDRVVERAEAEQTANALPRDGFYAAEPTGAEPGTLLRAEPFGGWSLPDGVRATRIVYESRSAQHEPTATSAAVLTPGGPPPEGGWPVISWAHGATGVEPDCAPTLMRDLHGGGRFADYLDWGYAVVATDYSGLGAGRDHEFNTMPANANDVRYATAAAGEAVSGLSDRWVVAGHSQGGQAAWGAAAQQTAEPVGELVGAVALAPATPLDTVLPELGDRPGVASYLPYIAYALAVQDPGFHPQEILTPAGMRQYERSVHDGCMGVGEALGARGTADEYLRPDATENPAVRRFIQHNRYDDAPLAAPLFVVSGAADALVAAKTVDAVVAEQCRHATPVQYREYPGGHDTVVRQSAPEALQWIGARFAGMPPPDGCR
ncbi:hypothetical protein IQ251_12940 [Saccharopolyspora sp. HNM0983]|uniref:Secretory lipase n=1 Tax=Saccharopolyspora montiporae TaxID=2781240 RepID=A0A929G108_9PSEU|nr:lipase family protein [Saccharopolyspora sp. HNM0983]MBE9375352.1 hypothetical protein [Saccharopolyspora sp. HNM0983]